MQAYYETKTDDEGCVYQIPIRTDCFGYNNVGYDDYMIKAFLMQFNRFDETKYLIKYLYNLSKKIISLQSDKEAFYNDKEIELIKIKNEDNISVDTPDRNTLVAVQTPQCFKYDEIYQCHRKIKEENAIVTDDTSVVERYGHKVYLYEGDYTNIKITTPEDLILAERLI